MMKKRNQPPLRLEGFPQRGWRVSWLTSILFFVCLSPLSAEEGAFSRIVFASFDDVNRHAAEGFGELVSWNGCFVERDRDARASEPLALPAEGSKRVVGLPTPSADRAWLLVLAPGPTTLLPRQEEARWVRPFIDRSQACLVVEDSCQRSIPSPAVIFLESPVQMLCTKAFSSPSFPDDPMVFALSLWPADPGVAKDGFELGLDWPPDLA